MLMTDTLPLALRRGYAVRSEMVAIDRPDWTYLADIDDRLDVGIHDYIVIGSYSVEDILRKADSGIVY